MTDRQALELIVRRAVEEHGVPLPAIWHENVVRLCTDVVLKLIGAAEPPQAPAPSWVAITDRLPPEKKAVLLALSDRSIAGGSYGGRFGWWVDGGPETEEVRVTHWAEPPPAPSEG